MEWKIVAVINYKISLGRKSNTTVINELFFVGKRFTDKQAIADQKIESR